ncbi:MAG: addiction module protein [Planctomycetota bacterium]
MSSKEDSDLSPSERILRVQDLWDEIASAADDVDSTLVQIEDLRRRLKDHRINPRRYITWEELRAELEATAGDHDRNP